MFCMKQNLPAVIIMMHVYPLFVAAGTVIVENLDIICPEYFGKVIQHWNISDVMATSNDYYGELQEEWMSE